MPYLLLRDSGLSMIGSGFKAKRAMEKALDSPLDAVHVLIRYPK
jgi:hypothetical protein